MRRRDDWKRGKEIDGKEGNRPEDRTEEEIGERKGRIGRERKERMGRREKNRREKEVE